MPYIQATITSAPLFWSCRQRWAHRQMMLERLRVRHRCISSTLSGAAATRAVDASGCEAPAIGPASRSRRCRCRGSRFERWPPLPLQLRLLLSLLLLFFLLAGAADAQAIEILCGEIDQDRELAPGRLYVMTCTTQVLANVTLTIRPGTVIAASVDAQPDSTAPVLVILQGAKIMAEGEPFNPITLTSVEDAQKSFRFDLGTGEPTSTQTSDEPIGNFSEQIPLKGRWGGLLILGRAPTACPTGTCAYGFGELDYGGVDPHDDSGVIRYLRVWHGGSSAGVASEISGLTFAGVGDGTVVEHVEAAYCLDDGIMWIGGTVNAKWLSSIFNDDDAFDVGMGFQGSIQFVFGMVGNTGDAGLDVESADVDAGLNVLDPLSTSPTLSSVTILGGYNRAGGLAKFRSGAGGDVSNMVLAYGKEFGDELSRCGSVNITQDPDVPEDSGSHRHSAPTRVGEADYLYLSLSSIIYSMEQQFSDFDVGCNANGASELIADGSDPGFAYVLGPLNSSDLTKDFDPLPASNSSRMCTIEKDNVSDRNPFFREVDCIGAFADVDDNWLYPWSILIRTWNHTSKAPPPSPPPSTPPSPRPASPPASSEAGMKGYELALAILLPLLALILVAAYLAYRRGAIGLLRGKLRPRAAPPVKQGASDGPGSSGCMSTASVTAPSALTVKPTPGTPSERESSTALAATSTSLNPSVLDAPSEGKSVGGQRWSARTMPLVEWGSYQLIEWDRVEVFECIGTGANGDVYRASYAMTDVALKLVKQRQVSQTQLDDMIREYQLMLKLRHPNVLLMIGVTSDRTMNHGILTELMDTSLHQLLEETPALLSWQKPLTAISHDVCKGMAYLHSHGVLHRDLKPANVLLKMPGFITKVADFGSSKEGIVGKDSSFTMTMAGTPVFMAPEVLRQDRSGKEADVWSFGCLLVHMATKKPPYAKLTETTPVYALMQGVAQGDIDPMSGVSELNPDWPEQVDVIAKRCVAHSRGQRPTFSQLAVELARARADLGAEPADGKSTYSKGEASEKNRCGNGVSPRSVAGAAELVGDERAFRNTSASMTASSIDPSPSTSGTGSGQGDGAAASQ